MIVIRLADFNDIVESLRFQETLGVGSPLTSHVNVMRSPFNALTASYSGCLILGPHAKSY